MTFQKMSLFTLYFKNVVGVKAVKAVKPVKLRAGARASGADRRRPRGRGAFMLLQCQNVSNKPHQMIVNQAQPKLSTLASFHQSRIVGPALI